MQTNVCINHTKPQLYKAMQTWAVYHQHREAETKFI